MLEYENVEKCFKKAAKRKRKSLAEGKRNRKHKVETVADVLAHLDEEIPKFIDLVQTDQIEIIKHAEHNINENNCKKVRNIIQPYYKYEQVLHHCIVSQLQPIILHGLYEFSYGSIPGRGTHSGKKVLEKWIQKYDGKKFYVGQGDVKGFYDNIDLDILESKLAKVCRDKRFLHINHRIISVNEKITVENGVRRRRFIPKGFYTSGWYGHLILKEMDHMIVQLPGVDHYIRYADDFVITGRNKKLIHKAMQTIAAYLSGNLHLEMKHTWQVYRFEYVDRKTGKVKGRFIDFMGFQFHRDRTTMRKRNLFRSRRKARRIGKKTKVTWYDAAGMLSYMGMYTHTNTYRYYCNHIKPYVNIRKMKRTVSNHSKKQNRKEHDKHDRMEENHRNTDGMPGGGGCGILADNRVFAQKCQSDHADERKRRIGADVGI